MDDLERLFIPTQKTATAPLSNLSGTLTYWEDAWMRLKKNKLALCGLFS